MSTVQSIIDQLNVLRVEDPAALLSVKIHLEQIIQAAEFPRLTVKTLGEGDDTWTELHCPVCDMSAMDGTLAAVDVTERWTYADPIDMGREVVPFFYEGHGDYESAGYYLHNDDHPVLLPEGWTEVAL